MGTAMDVQSIRSEWAQLRNALESLETAQKRIHSLGHTLTTARERFEILDKALKASEVKP